MAAPPLLAATDLADFPGAPFPDAVVDAAASAVRREVGWHIAPSITGDTARVVARGRLFLRTLHLTGVTGIVDVTDPSSPETEDLDDWDWTSSGVLYRRRSPTREGRVFEVTYTHGYESCPADLLPALAYRCQRAKIDSSTGSVRLGSLSLNPSSVPNTSVAEAAQPDAIVRAYRIPGSR